MSRPVPEEVRRRVEDRYRNSVWRIYVCGEPDGENCPPGSRGVSHHECEAGRRARLDAGDPPQVVFIEVIPRLEKPPAE